MIKFLSTAKSNYNIDELDMDDIVLDTKENVIILKKEKYPFMTITDTIDPVGEMDDSSVAMSQKGVKSYIIETEETYTNAANALKAENAELKALIGQLINRVAALEEKIK